MTDLNTLHGNTTKWADLYHMGVGDIIVYLCVDDKEINSLRVTCSKCKRRRRLPRKEFYTKYFSEIGSVMVIRRS